MPPPRATRSTTTQLSRQIIQEPEESDPLTDIDELIIPRAKNAPGRKKLPVNASPSQLR